MDGCWSATAGNFAGHPRLGKAVNEMRSGRAVATLGTIAAATCPLSLPAVTSAASGSFTQRANQACAAAGAKAQRQPPARTLKQANADLAIVHSLITKLKMITPPTTKAKQYKLFVAETQAGLTSARRALIDARRKDKAAVLRDLKQVTAAGKASNRSATALGLRACAKTYTANGK